jgi:MFS family permease
LNRWAVAWAGAVALAVAMGIGRFAFTPVLPMMLHDGVIDLPQAGWLASANYLGYLAGALLCTLQPWLWARAARLPPIDGPALVKSGLAVTGLLTLGMALPHAALWPLLRFAAGVASAVVFVFTSGWCLGQLARLHASALGGVMYAGPGAGIVASGLLASGMVALQWRAAAAWAVFGALAWLLTAAVWRSFGSDTAEQVREATLAPEQTHTREPIAPAAQTPMAAAHAPAMAVARTPATAAARAPVAEPPATSHHGRGEVALLAFTYGLAGFGYIVTATFLPVIARTALPGSAWPDLFWPLFGAAVVAGALLSTRLRVSGDLRALLAASYVMQAAGIGLSLWLPNLAGFALGSVLLGLPFTAITFFAMQEVRRMRPQAVPATMGLLTAMYGIGQIAGPPMAAALVQRSGNAGAGFTQALEIAAAALLFGALLFACSARARRAPALAEPDHRRRTQRTQEPR